MTSSKIQNEGKLSHIQTMCQRFLSTTEPNETISKVKMRLYHRASHIRVAQVPLAARLQVITV